MCLPRKDTSLLPTAERLLETLQHYRLEAHHKLHAFVLMPDHIHLLLTPQTITLERAVMLLKGGFSHRSPRRCISPAAIPQE